MRLRIAGIALVSICMTDPVHATLLRVMTYNIHHALGKDGNLNLNRIASVINAANPDVVSLQEVDNNVPRSNNVLQMQQLGSLTGMQHYFGKARNLDGGGYGNGVLVRNGIDIVSTTNHQLPNPDNVEPRAVVEMNLSVDDNSNTTEFKFFATHLMHDSSAGRIDSMQFINGLVSGTTTPAILAGDMNYNPGSPAFNIADNQWDDATNINNSGKNRANQIDYIFYRSNSQWDVTTQSQFIINATTNVASDHHPLLGVLDLDNPWPDNSLVWNINSGASTPISDGFATGNGNGQLAFFPASPWDAEYNTGEQNLILGYNANAALTGNATRTIGSMRVGTNAAGAIISGRNGNGTASIGNSVNLTIADTANTTGDLAVGEGGYTGTINWNSSGTLDVQGNLRVGQAGVGLLRQTAGTVTSNDQVSIGASAGGCGSYTITGGSLATATDGSGAFRIGENSGTGTLRVEGAASVSHGAEMYIGSGTSGIGRLELIGSGASVQVGQLANANGVNERITWQASASGVTPINVSGAGPLASNRVQLQSTTEAAANTGSGSTLSGDGIGLQVNLAAYAGNGPLTLINNQTADPVTGYFENANRTGDLHQQNAPIYGTGYEGAVRVSYTGGTGNDVVLNLTNINADPRLIVRLKGDDVAGADGAAVSSWTDAKSGDTFNATLAQSTAAARPVKRANAVNGHAAVDFDGVDDVLLSSQTNSLPNVNNGITVFMVAQSDQGSEAAERAAQLGRSDGAVSRVVGMDLSSTSTSVSEGGAGFRWNNGRSNYSAGIDDANFHIIAFQVDHNANYSSAKMFVDGTQTANTFTGATTDSTATTQLNGSTLELLLGTGRLNGGGLAPNDYYDGQIAEFLVYNAQLSIEDVNIIGDALSAKYNLPFAFSFNQSGTTGPVPEPKAIVMLLSGILSVGLVRRRGWPYSATHHARRLLKSMGSHCAANPSYLTVAGLLSAALVTTTARGAIILSEVLYGPQASGVNHEWVEVYNTGSTSVNLSGWQFGLPGASLWTGGLPGGTTLGAGQALVLTPNAATFDDDWGTGKNRIQVSSFPALPDDPSGSGGRIAIRNGSGVIQNEITYTNGAGWPLNTGNDGHSIYVLPQHLNASSNGANWRPSSQGVYGAYYRNGGANENHASPAFVATQQQAPFEPSADAMWSMVVLPDIQNYTSRTQHHLNVLKGQTQWIADNKNAFNIQVVLQEGDITNTNSNDGWWENAVEGMSTLNGVVPYIMTAGNHDFNAQSPGRSTQFNTYFKVTDNPLVNPATGGILKGTMEPNRLENAYFEFTAPDGRNMLIFSLEHWPRDSVLNWAKGIAQQSQYADHTAVMLNHAILDSGGGFWNVGSEYYEMDGGNDGQQIWNKLLDVAPNIEMTFSGHVGGDGVSQRTEQNNAGIDVNMMLLNSQFETNGGNGWMRVLEFLDDGKTVRVRTFSPHFDLQRTGSAHAYNIELTQNTLTALVWNDNGAGGSVPFSDGFARSDGDGGVGSSGVSPYLAEEKEDLFIGYNGSAVLSGNGSRTVGSLRIGTNLASALITGRNGNGTFTASGSTSLTLSSQTRSGDLVVGEGGFTGTVNWNSSGTLDTQGRLRVGQGGTGVVNQNDGIVIGGSGSGSGVYAAIGSGAGSNGAYNLNAGTLRTGSGFSNVVTRQIIVGESGSEGTLNVGDAVGSANTAVVEANENLVIGRTGGTGVMNVRSDGKVDLRAAPAATATLLVGHTGSGAVSQTGGLVTSNDSVQIGVSAGGTGQYAISGGSLNSATDGGGALIVGNSGGTGTLRVQNSGAVAHGAELYVGGSGAGSAGRLELLGSAASFQVGQLENATGNADETIRWQADASGVTTINVTGAGPLALTRVQLQDPTEVSANAGSGATLSGNGTNLELDLRSYSASGALTLVNNQTADAVTGYFENRYVAGDLHEQNSAIYGTGYAGTARISYTGGTGNDVVVNLTNFQDDTRQIVRLQADSVAGADGTSVSSWSDLATGDTFNGTVSQGTAASRPVKRTSAINGRSAVEFDGVNDVLLSSQTNSLTTATGGITVFVVAQADQGNDAAERIAQIGRSTGAAGAVAGLDLSSTSTSVADGGAGFRYNNGRSSYSAGINDADFHIVAFQVGHNEAYSDAIMYVDGTLPANTFTGSGGASGTTVFNGSQLELLLGNGRLSGGGLAPNDYYDGQIAELMVYNGQLSKGDINLVADYLSTTYALPFAFDFTGTAMAGYTGSGGAIPEPGAACLWLTGATLLTTHRRLRASLHC